MKVALYANRLAEPVQTMSGIGRYIKELVTHLPHAASESHFSASAPQEKEAPDWLPPQVAYRPLPGWRLGLQASWMVAGQPRLERLVDGFDLVHVLHPSFPVPTRRTGVLTVHDLNPLERADWHSPGERAGFRSSLRRAVDSGWVIITVSDHVRDLVRAWAPSGYSRIVTVHLGIGKEFLRGASESRGREVCDQFGLAPGRFLVSVGRHSTRKNLAVLLEAIRHMGRAAPTLALAGATGAASSEISGAIDAYDLGEKVRLLGFVPDVDLVALVQCARGLVHPSTTEGFGLPVLEAMAVGTPVLASNGGSLPEIVGDAGVLLDPSNPALWAEQVAALMADDQRHAELRQRGRVRSGMFSWKRTAERTVAAYEQALSPS